MNPWLATTAWVPPQMGACYQQLAPYLPHLVLGLAPLLQQPLLWCSLRHRGTLCKVRHTPRRPGTQSRNNGLGVGVLQFLVIYASSSTTRDGNPGGHTAAPVARFAGCQTGLGLAQQEAGKKHSYETMLNSRQM